jgi:hypothetical protein
MFSPRLRRSTAMFCPRLRRSTAMFSPPRLRRSTAMFSPRLRRDVIVPDRGGGATSPVLLALRLPT